MKIDKKANGEDGMKIVVSNPDKRVFLGDVEGVLSVELAEYGFLFAEPGKPLQLKCTLHFTPTPAEYEALRKALKLPTREKFLKGAKTAAMRERYEGVKYIPAPWNEDDKPVKKGVNNDMA